MNIEGTPHEKALLVVFAYLIGFTTAYIAFGFTTSGMTDTVKLVQVPTEQSASVAASANGNDSDTDAPATPATDVPEVVYENSGLYVHTGVEFPTLLSKDISALDTTFADRPALSDKQGFHTAIPAYEHFASTGYVYYCEQHDDASCVPMLYSLDDEQLYVVQNQSGPLALSIAEASAVQMTPAAGLLFANYRSTDRTTPWFVTAQ